MSPKNVGGHVVFTSFPPPTFCLPFLLKIIKQTIMKLNKNNLWVVDVSLAICILIMFPILCLVGEGALLKWPSISVLLIVNPVVYYKMDNVSTSTEKWHLRIYSSVIPVSLKFHTKKKLYSKTFYKKVLETQFLTSL